MVRKDRGFLIQNVVGFLVVQLAAVAGHLSASFSASIVVGALQNLLSFSYNRSWWDLESRQKTHGKTHLTV